MLYHIENKYNIVDRDTCLFCSVVAFECSQLAYWLCLSCLHVLQESNLWTSRHWRKLRPSVHATKAGTALKVVLKLSKDLIAYMEGLLAVTATSGLHREQPAVDASVDSGQTSRPEGGNQGRRSVVEAMAAGLYSISKAFRPEFDARGAPGQERAQVLDSTVPGLHSTVFGSRPPQKGTDYAVECCLQWTVSCPCWSRMNQGQNAGPAARERAE
jgi:hypothetical protein